MAETTLAPQTCPMCGEDVPLLGIETGEDIPFETECRCCGEPVNGSEDQPGTKRKFAISLIEILVVLSIVGILIALFLPAVG